MKTVAPINNLYEGSWAEDYTPSEETRRKYLYAQCMGYYRTSQNYNVIKRSNLSSYLVIYTVSGQGCIEYKGQKTFLSPNQTVIIDCTLPHSYYNAPECNWDFHWLHFYGSGIEGYLADIIDNWAPVEIPDMDEFFNNLYKNEHDSNPLGAVQSSTRIINLCSSYLMTLKTEQTSESGKISPVVRNAASYLEEHLSEDISLDTMCENMKVSKYYLSHIFKEQIGCSPYEYLITIRLSTAKALLRSTDKSVSEIAELCGFNKCSYFIQLF
ncbi:MAG: helix-turn-helix domain-containing protein, partial [Eubacterium sp.]|nr:helix-turn-helix domain-containing protein [Eubacterium sp.]